MSKMLIKSSVEDCVTLVAFDFVVFIKALVVAEGVESLAPVAMVFRLLGGSGETPEPSIVAFLLLFILLGPLTFSGSSMRISSSWSSFFALIGSFALLLFFIGWVAA